MIARAASRFRSLTRRRRRVVVLAGLYLTFLAMTIAGCTDRLILFPSTDPIEINGTERIEVSVPGSTPVEVWVARSRGVKSAGEPKAYVMEFVGNASRAEWMCSAVAEEWGDKPVEVWALNYPGYGGSPGPARLKSIPPAALAAFEAMAARANGRPVFLRGESLGTAAALYVAANRPGVSGLVLYNPPPLRSLILGRFGWWNLWLAAGPVALSIPDELDSLRIAPKVRAPAAFVLAGRDSVVPPKYQQKVVEAYAGERRLIHAPEADHNDELTGAAVDELVAAQAWLWAKAFPAAAAATTQSPGG
jgi:pimeloyl-ACP methyl ester carboxylesterase